MKLKESIKEFISNNCTGDLFKNYHLDIEELCEVLGIEIVNEDLDDQAANIKKNLDGDNFIIQLDSFNLSTFGGQRYVIAHQIGHYISYVCGSFSQEKLDDNKGCTWKLHNNKEYSKAEHEAHLIASYLLMPEEMVKNFMEMRLPLNEIVHKFKVSHQLAKKRLDSIDPYYFQRYGYQYED